MKWWANGLLTLSFVAAVAGFWQVGKRVSEIKGQIDRLNEQVGKLNEETGAPNADDIVIHSADDVSAAVKKLGKTPRAKELAECLGEFDLWSIRPEDEAKVRALKLDLASKLRHRVRQEVVELQKAALETAVGSLLRADAPTYSEAAKRHAEAGQILSLYPMSEDKAVIEEAKALSVQQAEVASRIEVIRRQRYNRWSVQQIDYAIWGYNDKSSFLHPTKENKELIDSLVSTLGQIDPVLLEPVALELYSYVVDLTKGSISEKDRIDLAKRLTDSAVQRKTFGRFLMHRSLTFAVLWTITLSATISQAEITYTPLGRWGDPQAAAYRQWEMGRQAITDTTRVNPNRPLLPGLRPRNLELLQDALRRKFTTKVTSDAMARKHIIRLAGNRSGLNVLNGAMAEALFADRNPEFDYVKKPNAPQHDFTRARVGGGRENVQVKFHENGDPATYTADMKKDWRANYFAIPDDHVDSLKAYLARDYQRLKATGDQVAADQVAKQRVRVRGIRANSAEITTVRGSARYAAREQYAIYTSFGASLALALGPILWDSANGDLSANKALYQSTRAMSLLGIGLGTDLALQGVRQGALRGTWKGNVIVGTALTITEATWLVYEHGWSRAFYSPQFYESVGGSVGGIALGLVGSGAAEALIPGPGWVVGTATVVTGAVAGTVGYVGGRNAMHSILGMIAPQMLQQDVQERLREAKANLNRRLAEAQRLSVE